MFLPLYKNEHDDTPKNKPADANAGLWFERFFDQFDADAGSILDSKTINGELKQGSNFWLQKFKKAGNTEALQDTALRQMDLVKQLKGGENKFFSSQWHFVTGTGYPHPVENGLLWHRVHGVPYLSGAAVKGLVRAWVEEWAGFEDPEKRKRLLFWFGSESKQSTANQSGDIIFFDALPVKEVSLVTDIMTPHYGKWYSDGLLKSVQNFPGSWGKER